MRILRDSTIKLGEQVVSDKNELWLNEETSYRNGV
jgi:hypothetical protein